MTPQTGLCCPKDQSRLTSHERNGVTVDRCTECGGIFLDRGELKRLIDAEGRFNDEQVAATRITGRSRTHPATVDAGVAKASSAICSISAERLWSDRQGSRQGRSPADKFRSRDCRPRTRPAKVMAGALSREGRTRMGIISLVLFVWRALTRNRASGSR